ncbi:hypothetical protein BDV95DRAFT_488216 [Massariosphaeria phaeospora]|uniref:FAD-binding PCMH-type domain-containing protein n=1 Tax=Massariosphaeria phaeospora TaxID=100035 RepID=A0A7C8IDV1_9PLEO|nr:hypothetical protein BDV95DRAFT_488216 [Massariosphaeria phaeospora]
MACEKLRAALPGKVSLADEASYNSSVNSYYFRSARQRPSCVVSPTSTEDLSTAIKVLTGHPEVQFAVRSGGHQPHPEVSNTDHGITINLGGLNTITKSIDNDDVYRVGVGAGWINVYEVLDRVKRTALGSRESTVGVGGFITGGGLSYFAPERGFACDYVVNMEVVLASGEIIEVNDKSHPDLFWALKGGRSNFGIVTRIDITTFQLESFWGGATMYPWDAEDAALEAFIRLKMSGDYEPLAQVELSFLYSVQMGGFLVSANHWYLRPVENPQAFRHFAEIEPQMANTMRIDSTINFARELTKYQPQNKCATFVTTTFFINASIMKKINKIWEASAKELSSVQDITSVITYQQCPPPPKDSENAMGFAPQSSPHEDLLIFIVSVYWERQEDSDFVRDKIVGLMADIEGTTKQEGVFHPFKYINYAAPWQQSLKSYGEESYRKLNEVSRTYDPHGVFQSQAIGFKL